MTARVAHRLPDVAASVVCTRCLTVCDLAAGYWHAGEPGNPHGWVCDRCAERDDAQGFGMVASFRRMSRPTWRSAA